MPNRNSKFEFLSILIFLLGVVALLTNGFTPKISAQSNTKTDIYQAIEPIGHTLQTILDEYVKEVDINKIVEGALVGMMSSLDRHSSYISSSDLKTLRDDTQGEFEGIGVSIKMDDNQNVIVFMPIPNSPAAKAGLKPFDIIRKIDGIPVEQLWKPGMSEQEKLSSAAEKIRGPIGTKVQLTIERPHSDKDSETFDVTVERAKVPLESIKESRILPSGYGYVRLSDFKENTASDLKKTIKEMLDKGIKGFILDLRWNPGGLLTASQQVCELFLPKDSLVTYTRSRGQLTQENGKDLELKTRDRPVLPLNMPMILLVNNQTASSSEIVTGALQYHQRALIVGEKTFGKGSVQTIIPLPPKNETALRLTTALYYTPAGVTIDHEGILPDIVVEMTDEEERLLALQMYKSYEKDPSKINEQNHGSVTGNEIIQVPPEKIQEQEQLLHEVGKVAGEDAVKLMKEFFRRKNASEGTVEDTQLKKAVEILGEDPIWENLIKKYHKDVKETQKEAKNGSEKEDEDSEVKRRLLEIELQNNTPPVPSLP
ncbi:MAG TPA: S41 family peptidase [Candidatus Hydrogenedens sp.]|nr:S41 family peptidase [Candidatus Hydrogenedens sp.]HOL20764.1 S41 family peptidase [Candidatus Hydrogenedens sp.]HPP57863.1 S41 family peptidase [Candidatus Hydrogenedens sp.]